MAKFRILTFCGGGIRGLLSVHMLEQLMNTGTSETMPDVIKNADLIAGTSTGAVITAAIACGAKVPELKVVYDLMGDAMKHPGGDASAPAFTSHDWLVDKLECWLPGVAGRTLADLHRKVLLTGFDVGSADNPWSPKLFHNMSGSDTADTLLLDAMIASSAMPGMYGAHKGLVDGGFVNHDPTIAAIAVAVGAGVALEDITVLNFGTGFMPNWINGDTTTWGVSQWLSAPETEDTDNLPHLLVNQKGPPMPILNILLNGTSTKLVPHLAGLMLGDRYACLNPTLKRNISEISVDEEDIACLTASADECTSPGPSPVGCTDYSRARTVANAYWS